MTEETQPLAQPITLPDIYTEGVHIQGGFSSVALFLTRSLPDGHAKYVGIVRMSPQQAKALGALLTSLTDRYERDTGTTLFVPPDFLQVAGLPEQSAGQASSLGGDGDGANA